MGNQGRFVEQGINGIEESYLNPNFFRVITLFEGLWLLSIDRAERERGGEG